MKSLVILTGGAGYIGSVLARYLLDNDYEVRVLDNFLYGQNSLLDCCSDKRFEIIRGDVRSKETVKKAIEGCQFIVHLAALVGAPACDADPDSAVSVNVGATKLLLSLRRQDQKIIFPCTNSGYGIGQEGILCTEETPLRPISTYGKTKVEAERMILQAKNSISFRLATVFGASPRLRLDLIVNDFVRRAMYDKYILVFEGHFKRNYIHVRDVARALLFGMEHFEGMKDNVYNVGLSDANLSKLELCAVIKRHFPDFTFIESPVGEDPDKRNYIVSNAKIEGRGFRTQFSLDMGVEELRKALEIAGRNPGRSFTNFL